MCQKLWQRRKLACDQEEEMNCIHLWHHVKLYHPSPLIFKYLVQYTYSPGMDRNKCLKLLRSVSPIGLTMSYHLPRRSCAYQSLLIKLILTVVIYHSLTIIMDSSLAGVRPRPDWSHICMHYHHYLHHQNQKQKQS